MNLVLMNFVLMNHCSYSTTEPKEKRQRVQSEDDSVPASTIASPLCTCSAQSVNALTRLLHTNTQTPQGSVHYKYHVHCTDLGEHILYYLDILSLSRAELVCGRWNEVIVYRRLWRKLYEKNLKM